MEITNKMGLPQPLVSVVESDYEYTDKRYSVTSILKGTREAILQRRHDGEIKTDVSEMIWLILGKGVHYILESARETDTQLKEEWVSADMPNGYVLSGIFDLYDDATGTVTDWKTTSVWKVIYDEWDDYRQQTLAYVWILRQMGFANARRGEVVAILKDHSMTKAATDLKYPPYPVFSISWDFTDEEIEEFGKWAAEKFLEIERCEKLPDEELPLCTEEQRWHKPDTWAVVKRGNKRASKVCNSEAEAVELADKYSMKDGKPYEVQFRQGEDSKCLKYCSVCQFCEHGKSMMRNA